VNCPKLEGILTGSNFNKPSSSRREDLFGLLKIWKQSMSVMLVGIMLLFAGCTTQPLPGAIDSNSYFAQGVEARIRGNNGIPPTVGLALAGGGTKAANFSIGVLQGLTETGVMERVDVISTVSGGGYGALWYFSRLLNPEGNPQTASVPLSSGFLASKFFQDCLPIKYVEYYADSANISSVGSRESYSSTNPIWSGCPRSATNYDVNSNSRFHSDPVRYQNHLRGYQDLFGSNAPFRYNETTRKKLQVYLDYAGLSALTLGAMAINVVPNLVFDWEIPLSPSRRRYEAGIVRTFGATPHNCNKLSVACSEDTRPLGDEAWVRNDLTFSLLRQQYEKGAVPLWVINATAGENRSWLYFDGTPEQKRFQLTAFEFSPYGSGSGLFRYSTNQLDDLRPWQAVTSSAAFLDSQQKVLKKWLAIANPALKLTTLDWGRSVPNPHISLAENIFHKLLPFPLYLLHGRAGDSADDFVNIRLSDGGQSENLGVYALVQRKLEDVIVSDHSADRSGSMADLCRLKYGLLRDQGPEPLYVYFPGLANLDQVCNQDLELGYDIFRWDHPIVLGCITSNPRDVICSGALNAERPHFQRLYLIKPALPSAQSHDALGRKLEAVGRDCRSGTNTASCKAAVVGHCHQFLAGDSHSRHIVGVASRPESWPLENDVSCELISFMMINAFNKGGFDDEDLCPYVPQNGTAAITADSSPFLFGAYRDLGSYYATQLRWFFGSDSVRPMGDIVTRHNRYRQVIESQMQDALIPVTRFVDGKRLDR
jgi:hypothetical protein